MCLACVGACPEGAILDNRRGAAAALHRDEVRPVRHLREDLPRARDHARAAALPRAPRREQPRVLNEAAIVNCIACGKPLGHARR